MFAVEALIPDLSMDPRGIARDEWTPVFDVPQGDSREAERNHARAVASMAGRFYVNVRIVETHISGMRLIVASE